MTSKVRTVIINASDLAGAIGFNPYKSIGETLDKVLERNFPRF